MGVCVSLCGVCILGVCVSLCDIVRVHAVRSTLWVCVSLCEMWVCAYLCVTSWEVCVFLCEMWVCAYRACLFGEGVSMCNVGVCVSLCGIARVHAVRSKSWVGVSLCEVRISV